MKGFRRASNRHRLRAGHGSERPDQRSDRDKGLPADGRYVLKVRATRAYLAGFGTSGSLLAGAALMFLLASAIVAFRGWPQVGSQPPPVAVSVSRASLATPSRAQRVLIAAAGHASPTALAAGTAGTGRTATGGGTRAAGSGGGVNSSRNGPGGGGANSSGSTPANGQGSAGGTSTLVPSIPAVVPGTISNAGGSVSQVVSSTGQSVGSTVGGVASSVASHLSGSSPTAASAVSNAGSAAGSAITTTSNTAASAVNSLTGGH